LMLLGKCCGCTLGFHGYGAQSEGRRRAMPESFSAQESKILGMDPAQSVEEHRRCKSAERQRRSRDLQRVQGLELPGAEGVEVETNSTDSGAKDTGLDARTVADVGTRLRQFLMRELRCCDSRITRVAIMEEFLNADEVRAYLPKYFPAPEDAKAQFHIIQSIRDRLDTVKGVQCSEMLVYKGAILDAVVAGDVRGKGRAMGRVLQVRPENIWAASRRHHNLESTTSSQMSLPKRRKRADVLDPHVTHIVNSWWVNETRISPCSKDTRRKHVKRNTWVRHPIHLLVETLVNFFSYLLARISSY
jgi:hypothetical protein